MFYLVLLIIVLANGIFWLVPGGEIAGVVKPADVGLVLTFAVGFWSIMKPQTLLLVRDAISISIFVLIVLLTLQAAFASLNYGQPIINGLIAIRDQFYYLSFFGFLAVLNSEEKIVRFLDICSVLGLAIAVIAIANYLFGGIYKHQFAESQSIRSGVVRAQVAGMDIITLSLLWQTAKLTAKKQARYSAMKYGVASVFFMGMHFFRQTRSRLVAVLAVLGWLMYTGQQKKLLILGVGVIVIAALVAEVALKENIILNPFISTAEVAQDYEGEVPGRIEQLRIDIGSFMENPVFGSGSAALRASEAGRTGLSGREASELARKSDLGYTHWLKAYGLIGAFWLVWFYVLLWSRLRYIDNRMDREKSPLPIFMLGYFYFILISFVTLNHFMFGYRIMLVCALAAMAVNLSRLYKRVNTI